MPYKNLKDLPQPVQDHLPIHAQEIYLAAFNHAWEEYKIPDKRKDDSSQEEVSHKVAWAAVKKKYTKKGEEWHLKPTTKSLKP
jgi:cation transport regulator